MNELILKKTDMVDALAIFFITCFIVIIILSILFNAAMIATIAARFRKRTIRDSLLLSLSICDTFRSAVSAPMEVHNVLSGTIYRTDVWCNISKCVVTTFQFNAITHLAFLIVDRYVCACKPAIALKVYSSTAACYLCITFCWIYSLCFALLPMTGIARFTAEGGRCSLSVTTDTMQLKVYIVIIWIFILLLPSAVIFVCSILTLDRFRKDRQRCTSVFQQEKITVYSRQEKKYTRLILAMAFIFILTWFPYGVVIAHAVFTSESPNSHVWLAVKVISQSSGASTPLIFMIISKEFRKTSKAIHQILMSKIRNIRSCNKVSITDEVCPTPNENAMCSVPSSRTETRFSELHGEEKCPGSYGK